MNSVGHHYVHEPLVEAVIELRLKEPLPEKVIEAVGRRFNRLKWPSEELFDFTFEVAEGTPRVGSKTLSGYKITSKDGDRVVSIGHETIAASVLAPYPGWDAFVAFFWETNDAWRKEVGERRPLARMGVRYVNRFDIPCPPGEVVQVRDYMTFGTTEPALLDDPDRHFTATVHGGILADRLRVNVVSATVVSPLIDHVSLSLDIDLYKVGVDVPTSTNEITSVLNLIRERRTEVFELCITDKARALIS